MQNANANEKSKTRVWIHWKKVAVMVRMECGETGECERADGEEGD